MSEKIRTIMIRPGILVAMKTSLDGGVNYERKDLAPAPTEVIDASGDVVPAEVKVERWETTKITIDPDEHARAVKARGLAVTAIRRCCADTPFGLLCPVDDEAQLDAGIAAAREIERAHNAGSTHTRISIRVLKARVANDDVEAAREIGREVAAMIRDMGAAIDRLDPEAIRKAADRVREMGTMLDVEGRARVGAAVEQARIAAREITKRVIKGAEPAAVVLATIQRSAIEQARVSFLDLGTPIADEAAVEIAMPSIAVARVAELDLVEDAPAAPAVVAGARVADLDLGILGDGGAVSVGSSVVARDLDTSEEAPRAV